MKMHTTVLEISHANTEWVHIRVNLQTYTFKIPSSNIGWVTKLRFIMVFLSPSKKLPGYYLPTPFQFIIHESSYHSMLHSMRC